MRRFENQTLKKTSLIRGRVNESKRNFGRLSQGSYGSSNLAKENDYEDVQNPKGMMIVNGQA